MPLDTLVREAEDKSVITTKYMDPHKLMDYLLNKCPRVLWGTGDFETAIKHCDDFWAAYREHHGTHQIYSSYPNELAYTIPLAVHGDEGRGKRRSQTTVVSYEAVLGLKGHRHCNKCRPSTTQESHPYSQAFETKLQRSQFRSTFSGFYHPWYIGQRGWPFAGKTNGYFWFIVTTTVPSSHRSSWCQVEICSDWLQSRFEMALENLLFDTWV